MADIPILSGNFPDGAPFNFTLNGVSTQRQMEKLIELTSILAKRITNPKNDPVQAAYIESLKTNTAQVNTNTRAVRENNQETVNFHDALMNLSTVSNIVRGNLTTAFSGINKISATVALGMGGMVGQLFDYSNQLGQAMQRGVAGGVMDFAIAAKTGGVTLGQFSKALEESGGSFAMLGNGATDGAKQFGSLVSEVRYATASVGNLGLSSEQLATFTAQQVKVAVAQGFKGRAASNMVAENSRSFAEELDNLTNRTGRSVLELAAAAQKLAMDPIVSNFVATARSGNVELSRAMQSYAANLEGLFGKAGEQLRTDALQNALAGLPLTMTEAGKNLQLASASVYGELQNQANRAAAGQTISEADTKRLRELVLREVDARRTELTYMAQIKGTAGDAAKQLLSLAAEARQYNTADGIKRREEDKAAQAFINSTNQLRANLQQLAIPFLELLNGVNWTLLINVLRGATAAVEVMLAPFSILGKILSDTGLGSVVGGLLGIASVVSIAMAGFTLFSRSLVTLTTAIKKHALSIGIGGLGVRRAGMDIPDIAQSKTEKPRYKMDTKTGKPVLIEPTITGTSNKVGKSANTALLVTGLVTSMLGGALSMVGNSKLAEDADSTLGKVASISGKILEWSGIILAMMPVFSSLVTAMPAIKLAVLGFSSMISTKLVAGIVAVNAGFGMVAAFLSTKLIAGLVAAKAGFGMVAAFLAKGLLAALPALAAIAAPALAVAAAVAAAAGAVYLVVKYWDNIVGLFSNIGKKLKDIFSSIFGIGKGKSGEVSDKRATTESVTTAGGVGGGIAGAAMGAKGEVSDKRATTESVATAGGVGGGIAGAAMGAKLGTILGIPGMLAGGLIGGALGTGLGYGAANLFTSDKPGNVSKGITDTQTTAIDSSNMRDTENTKQLSQLNKNIETLVASSDANLMVNGKIASITDNNSRYLRGATFGSA